MNLLDFSTGSGAALFATSKRGIDSVGIELLPVGCAIINARKTAAAANSAEMVATIDRWIKQNPWKRTKQSVRQSAQGWSATGHGQ